MPISETYGCADAMSAVETFACADAMSAVETFACAAAMSAVETFGCESAVDGDAPDTTAPGVPSGFSVAAVGTDTIRFTWTDPPDGDLAGIRIYGGTAPGSLALITTVLPGAQTYDWTGRSAATEYFGAVSAIDEVPNESAQTAEDSATTDAAYEAETLAFQTRVLADGGTVGDLDLVDALLSTLKDMGRYDDVRLLAGPELAYRDDSSAIGTLYDASGEANDLVQETTAAKPTLITSEDFAGRSVASFDGTDDHLTSLAATDKPFTIIMVGSYRTAGVDVMASFGPGTEGRIFQTTSNWRAQFGGSAFTYNARLEGAHLHVIGADEQIAARLDGVDKGSGATAVHPAQFVMLGQSPGGAQVADVDIALVCLLSGALSGAEAETLEAVIASHYGITLP